ncbi:MAG TPA: SAM-dependent methyltransferase [Amycolatopsis sp.]|nr:SAM-dependent methyltransferase [Amycolatopsis sp.]
MNHATPADRAHGDPTRHLLPVDTIARHNHLFTAEIRALAVAAGVTQVLDLGCGMPTAADWDRNHPTWLGIRQVAVDNDPIVISVRTRQHHKAASRNTHGYGASALPATLEADLRNPGAVLTSATVRRTLSLGKPTLLLATFVFHHIPNIHRPSEILARYLDALAPGSYIALSHLTIPHDLDGKRRLATARTVNPDDDKPLIARPAATLDGWLHGLEPVPVHEDGGRFLHVVAARKPTPPLPPTARHPRHRGPATAAIQTAPPGHHR